MSKGEVKAMLEAEINQRIAKFESPDYDYGQKIDKNDYLGILIVAILGIGLMVWGIS